VTHNHHHETAFPMMICHLETISRLIA